MPTESATRNNRAAEPATHRAYQDHARYDAFGNVWQTYVSGVPSLRQTGSSWYLQGGVVNNRLANTIYDAAGNQTQLSAAAGTVASFDGENRMSKIAAGGSEKALYTYDAEGRRVAKTVNGATTTYYFYDAAGQLMAEYGGPAETAATHYFTTDYLGSTRMILNATGACLERLDYAPFGGQISRSYDCYAGASSEKPLFTGQMRDGESNAGTDTGQDYFNARYLWANIARFTSPDAPFADQRPEDGQSWNMYAYVRGNPLRYVDPSGGECVNLDDGTQGDDGKGTACAAAQLGTGGNFTVGVGRNEANLIMLQGIGEGLSSPHQIGTIVSEAGQGAMVIEGVRGLPSLWRAFRSFFSGSGLITLGLNAGKVEQTLPGAAHNAANGARLARSLASEQQTAEIMSGKAAAIAGEGTATALRDAPRLAARYGGRAEEWIKIRSSNYSSVGGPQRFEIHAYQNIKTGQIVELKTKFQ